MTEQIKCGIYKITSPSNKIYIGKSIDIDRRFFYYKRCEVKTQRKLGNSLKKYGADCHVFEIIQLCKEDELNDLERHYIKLHDSFNTKHGLNLTDGGGNGRLSDETKSKIGQSKIGKKRKPFSAETIENMRKRQIGRLHSQETKKKMSVSQKRS